VIGCRLFSSINPLDTCASSYVQVSPHFSGTTCVPYFPMAYAPPSRACSFTPPNSPLPGVPGGIHFLPVSPRVAHCETRSLAVPTLTMCPLLVLLLEDPPFLSVVFPSSLLQVLVLSVLERVYAVVLLTLPSRIHFSSLIMDL